MASIWILVVLTSLCVAREHHYRQGNDTNVEDAREFLKWYENEAANYMHESGIASWNYSSNLTEHNKELSIEASIRYAKFKENEVWPNATSFAWMNFSDPLLRRQFKKLSHLGSASLGDEKLKEYNDLESDMKSTYSKARICPYKSTSNDTTSCNLSLDPDLTRIMATSEDYDELKHVWVAWRDAAGKPNREKFYKYMELETEIAHFDGYADLADLWLASYEDDEIEQEFERLWQQTRPLYLQLHAYVRRKLIEKYGNDKIKEDGPLPAHILGNMWAQTWENIYDLTVPFPNKTSVDVTKAMVEQGYTPLKMFKLAEKFFLSLKLEPMPESFWEKSIIEKPEDRDITCHASAWDFYDAKDFRIKQCTDVTMEYLETTHHEMGHIQYYLQYKHQPLIFRRGANSGFHEAVGDLMSVSVSTTKHLHEIGLLSTLEVDKEADINHLFLRALKKVAFLPFGYLIDKYRWGIYRGEIKKNELNSKWWEYRLNYQGLIPPVLRSEDDFDPAAKYHVATFVEYSRYYVAAILQLQFHKILCTSIGHQGPLHTCDLYNSEIAGAKLSEMLKLGSSKPWQEALGVISDGKTTHMDAGPLMEYFNPLMEWLKETNKNEFIGWKI